MFTRTKQLGASLFATAILFAGVAAPSASAANQQQNGLVNVAIGDITIQDVNIGVAAQIAANVCGLHVGPVAVLATVVDRTGDASTVCTTGDQAIRLLQD